MRSDAPPTPPLGATAAQVLELFPNAKAVRVRAGFRGTAYCQETADAAYHFVFVADHLELAVFNTRWQSESVEAITAKLRYLLDAYGGFDEFEERLDNGFGVTLVRKDKKAFALYAYVSDVLTVGPMLDGQIVVHDWESRAAVK